MAGPYSSIPSLRLHRTLCSSMDRHRPFREVLHEFSCLWIDKAMFIASATTCRRR